MGRLCGERGTAQALRAPAGRKKRVSPHPAPKHPEAPRTTPKRRACPLLPQQARPRSRRLRRGCAPAPHLRRPFRTYILGYTFLSPTGSDAPPRAPAPAAAGAPPRQPQPARSQPPAPHLRRPFRAYILGYTSLSPEGSDAPPRVSAPAAAGASRPLALRRGQEGSALLPRRKSSSGADLFRRPYLGTTAFFIPLTLSMAYRTASMVWLSWSGYRGRTRPLRSRSYS